MLTPRGPSCGPNGTPAVALPPSIIASTVFLSASFLCLSSAHELDVVRVHCYWKRCESFFEKLDDHFLLDLVDLCDLCFQTSKGSTDNLDEISNAQFLDYGSRYYESFYRRKRDDTLCSGSCVSRSGYRFVNEVWSHCLDENVSFDDLWRENSYDGKLLRLDSAGHVIDHSSLLAARCADCVYRGLLGLGCQDLSLYRVGVAWLAGSWYSPTTQKRILRTNPMPPTMATPIRIILMLSFVSCQSGFWAT